MGKLVLIEINSRMLWRWINMKENMNANNSAWVKDNQLVLTSWLGWKVRSRSHYVFASLATVMIVVGCVRIISTYNVFWQTWDEPFHIAAGMQWLDQGRFTYEPYHPPLARVLMAIGPYLNGVRIVDNTSSLPTMIYEGNTILHTGGAYEKNLALARLGILPFFIVASLVVTLWTRTFAGEAAALLATLLFTTVPPVLAHAGFATLDMACAAMVSATLFSLTLWLNKPDLRRSLLLGIVLGLTIISKLSTLAFLFVDGILIIGIYGLYFHKRKKIIKDSVLPKPKTWLTSSAVVLLLCTLTIWSGYRFSVRYLLRPENRPHAQIDQVVRTQGLLHDMAYFMVENVPIPAPEFGIGIHDFFARNDQGHLAFFLGDIQGSGRWYYFPVIFLFKTPLPFILLGIIGIFFILKNVSQTDLKWMQMIIPAIASLGVLATGMLGNIDNGLRQILSIYPLLATVAGYGAFSLISINRRSYLVGAGLLAILFSWQLISSFSAHPDYVAYFNELAMNHPEKIAVDSDLDWGQDLKRLASTLHDRGISEIKIKYNGSAGIDLTEFPLPKMQELIPYQHETGWIAISIFSLTLGTGQTPYDQFAWLRQYQPVEHVGKSILLYYVPAN